MRNPYKQMGIRRVINAATCLTRLRSSRPSLGKPEDSLVERSLVV
jgi:hypothetical protein